MKNLLAIFAIAAFMTACNDEKKTETTVTQTDTTSKMMETPVDTSSKMMDKMADTSKMTDNMKMADTSKMNKKN